MDISILTYLFTYLYTDENRLFYSIHRNRLSRTTIFGKINNLVSGYISAALSVLIGLYCFEIVHHSSMRQFHDGRAGRWSTCRRRHGNCGAGGIQTRHVQCMLGDGLIVNELLCPAELRPPVSRPCFVVCDHHRRTYGWAVDRWTECSATSLSNACSVLHHQPQVPPPSTGLSTEICLRTKSY